MLRVQSLYFEDLDVGLEIETPGRTITEADIVSFAGLSGDYNRLHTNDVYATSGPFEARIAHGLLGLSVTSGLMARLGIFEESVLAFRELTCKFRQPVLVGDTVSVHAQVIAAKPMPRVHGGLVELEVRLANQDNQVVQSGRWKVLVQNRDSGSG